MATAINIEELKRSKGYKPVLTFRQFLGRLGEHLVTKRDYERLLEDYDKKCRQYSVLVGNYNKLSHEHNKKSLEKRKEWLSNKLNK